MMIGDAYFEILDQLEDVYHKNRCCWYVTTWKLKFYNVKWNYSNCHNVSLIFHWQCLDLNEEQKIKVFNNLNVLQSFNNLKMIILFTIWFQFFFYKKKTKWFNHPCTRWYLKKKTRTNFSSHLYSNLNN